ncbi:S8 family serine peptidase [Streptomyces sp. NPDC002688]|uniref:S8 family serine peptidase n=1 Tax=Streptomyces sp. NPDC002688 TaxID=3154423 RepID=UPI003318537E
MNRLRRTVILATSVVALLVPAVAPAAPAVAPAVPSAHSAASAQYVVVLKDSVGDPKAASAAQVKAYGGTVRGVYSHAFKGYAAELTPDQAARLGSDPGVRFVSRSRGFHRPASHPEAKPVRCGTPESATGQCLPNWADRVEAERSSARSGDGRGSVGVRVAVIDDGIAGGHPDLNVRGGVDCSTGSPVVPGNSLSPVTPHGTAVAGVVGARDNEQGTVGVAPGTPLWAVNVFDGATEDATDAAVLCGIEWVTATRTDSDPANDITIANMSIGGSGTDDGKCGTVDHDVLHMAVCAAVRAGVTLVVNAGNDHADFRGSIPAAYDEVLTATAMADFDGRPGGRAEPVCYGTDLGDLGDADDQAVLGFSNFATSAADRRHAVAAPGDCMESTYLSPGFFALVAGTSFSAPVVTGVTALCVSVGRCGTDSPGRNLRTIVNDAKKANERKPRYGFFGDPLRPIPGRYYGHLVTADRY